MYNCIIYDNGKTSPLIDFSPLNLHMYVYIYIYTEFSIATFDCRRITEQEVAFDHPNLKVWTKIEPTEIRMCGLADNHVDFVNWSIWNTMFFRDELHKTDYVMNNHENVHIDVSIRILQFLI